MAGSLSVPATWASLLPTKQSSTTTTPRAAASSTCTVNACSSRWANSDQEGSLKRRPLLLGVGALSTSFFPTSSVFATEGLENYRSFLDKEDGYTYYYPSDWREFDFRGHDSAFKDRFLQLQNVRVSFKPTDKRDIHELGPMEEFIPSLLKHVYAAPTQKVTIYDMQERVIDGRNYYQFEYDLTSTNFSRTAFSTIAIANGRWYTLIVGANGRRWKRVRNQLKVVADSFKVLEI